MWNVNDECKSKKAQKSKAQGLMMQAIAKEIWKLEKEGADKDLLLLMDNQLKRFEKHFGWYEHANTILQNQ